MPSPIPIKRAGRPVRVHILKPDGGPYCGAKYKSFPVKQLPQNLILCARCLHLAQAANQRDFIHSLERQEIHAERNRRARAAYDIWAHRSLPNPPGAFDVLPDRQRQAWREVVEYFETEYKENHGPR
jgi:hypothetical protein